MILLQECERSFVEDDLKLKMVDYTVLLKIKGGKGSEGEAILFRNDRFKWIKIFFSFEPRYNGAIDKTGTVYRGLIPLKLDLK